MPQWSKVQVVLTDVDGVLTDGKLYIGPSGETMKAFCAHDGVGTKALLSAGIEVVWVTSRTSEICAHRAKELGVQHLLQGVDDKGFAVAEFLRTQNISSEHAVFIGDDVIDLPAFEQVGVCAAPANAVAQVLSAADYVSKRSGGDGAFREIADLLLLAHATEQT